MTPFVPKVARLNSQSPAPLGERNGSSSAMWTIAAVAVLALSSLAARDGAPTKSAPKETYNEAFRELDANN